MRPARSAITLQVLPGRGANNLRRVAVFAGSRPLTYRTRSPDCSPACSAGLPVVTKSIVTPLRGARKSRPAPSDRDADGGKAAPRAERVKLTTRVPRLPCNSTVSRATGRTKGSKSSTDSTWFPSSAVRRSPGLMPARAAARPTQTSSTPTPSADRSVSSRSAGGGHPKAVTRNQLRFERRCLV